jgi:hypothetical protein
MFLSLCESLNERFLSSLSPSLFPQNIRRRQGSFSRISSKALMASLFHFQERRREDDSSGGKD